MYEEILHFWFQETDRKQWWAKDHDFDRLVAAKYSTIHGSANQCELYKWRESPRGRLAEIIILDQFSRNIYRGLARAFASDALALALSQEAVFVGADRDLPARELGFLYMPFMHSESPIIHEKAVSLYAAAGLEDSLRFELRHKKIIDQFGRYPHRNDILGRQSTERELAFLKTPGSSF